MIDTGSRGERVKSLQRSINKRLRARGAANRQVEVDGVFGNATRRAMVTAAYLLGADKATYDGMRRGTINDKEVEFVRHPGRRSDVELKRGQIRVAAHRKARAKAAQEAEQASGKRKLIVQLAEKAAANYRANPGAYHYLAGGVANLVFLKPTPRGWRSDCSQFVASVYHAAGVSSPAAPLAHQWASTFSMVKSPHARVIPRSQRKPGDLGMYGSRTAPHHVELWCGNKFIGHGSPPIDSLTPGEPDYYITFDFLN
jgi:hypothetical protein